MGTAAMVVIDGVPALVISARSPSVSNIYSSVRLPSSPKTRSDLVFLARSRDDEVVFLCLAESIAFHVTIRLLAYLLLSYRRSNSVSTALVVSSCTKLFPILMVIWDYDVPAAATSVGWAVVVNNIEALNILLNCGYVPAAFLAASGALARLTTTSALLHAVGLGDVGWRAGVFLEAWDGWWSTFT